MSKWIAMMLGVGLLAGRQDTVAHARDMPRAVKFELYRPGLSPDRWAITVDANGAGKYEDLSGAEQGPAGSVRAVHVSAVTQERLGAGYATVATGKCETKEKNIARTGDKHIVYGEAACTFNFSDDEKLNDVAAAFQAIAQTVQTGDRLKHKHRFDHLGLDAELDSLLGSVKSGYAIELQNIAPILQSIANDEEMMTPARRKAKTLVEMQGALSAKQ